MNPRINFGADMKDVEMIWDEGLLAQVLIDHIMEERYSTWSIVLCTIELPQWAQCISVC